MEYKNVGNRISCGPVKQDWCDFTVCQQGFAPIHIKKWSDSYEKQPRKETS